MKALAERGVATRRGIIAPTRRRRVPAWPPLPASETARDTTLLLPLFDGLAGDGQQYVIEQLHALANRRQAKAAVQ
jgi:hypothetical protein